MQYCLSPLRNTSWDTSGENVAGTSQSQTTNNSRWTVNWHKIPWHHAHDSSHSLPEIYPLVALPFGHTSLSRKVESVMVYLAEPCNRTFC